MNLEKLRVGNYVKILMNDKYYIARIKGFIMTSPVLDTMIQLNAEHPRNEILSNMSISYESLKKLQTVDVSWNRAEILMKLIYG